MHPKKKKKDNPSFLISLLLRFHLNVQSYATRASFPRSGGGAGGGDYVTENKHRKHLHTRAQKNISREKIADSVSVPDENKDQVRSGYVLPEDLNSTHAVNSVLLQQKGKMRLRDLKKMLDSQQKMHKQELEQQDEKQRSALAEDTKHPSRLQNRKNELNAGLDPAGLLDQVFNSTYLLLFR